MFKYTLTNARRSACPFCGKDGKYSAFVNTVTRELAPLEYGMCSSCRNVKRPPDNCRCDESNEVCENIGYHEADKVNLKNIMWYYKPPYYIRNTLLEGLERRFGEEAVSKVVDLYKIGKFEDDLFCQSSAVVFPYFLTDDHCCTAKLMWFDSNLHRIKEGKKQYPKFYHNLIYTDARGKKYDFNHYDYDDDMNEIIIPFKLKMCLFGHHLVVNDKDKLICLVESEKTALVMAIVLPEFTWVASGGKTLIQDYKFMFFAGRTCLVFPDLSPDDNVCNYWKSKLALYEMKYGCNFKIIDYYTDFLLNDKELVQFCKQSKFDVADFILEFNQDHRYYDFLYAKLIYEPESYYSCLIG